MESTRDEITAAETAAAGTGTGAAAAAVAATAAAAAATASTGSAVHGVSIETRVESAYGSSA